MRMDMTARLEVGMIPDGNRAALTGFEECHSINPDMIRNPDGSAMVAFRHDNAFAEVDVFSENQLRMVQMRFGVDKPAG